MNRKPMLIITSSWNGRRCFKMIPIVQDCPYNEVIYDPEHKLLAIVSKEHKNNFHVIPVLDYAGNEKKGNRERVTLDTYYEYFIEDREEIINFVESLGDNSHLYDFKRFIE